MASPDEIRKHLRRAQKQADILHARGDMRPFAYEAISVQIERCESILTETPTT